MRSPMKDFSSSFHFEHEEQTFVSLASSSTLLMKIICFASLSVVKHNSMKLNHAREIFPALADVQPVFLAPSASFACCNECVLLKAMKEKKYLLSFRSETFA